jgi:ribosomal protein S18 acetylase RimI-like enzyme
MLGGREGGAMEIRVLAEGDEGIASRVLRSAKPSEELRGPASADHLAAFLRQPWTILAVALADEQPAGYAVAYELPRVDGGPAMIHLYEVHVAEAFRRRGVGTRLVEAIKNESAHRKAGSMWVLSDDGNAAAVRLYTGSGARRTVPDQVLLAWQLSPVGKLGEAGPCLLL